MSGLRAQAWVVAILLGLGIYLLFSHNAPRRVASGLIVAGIVGCLVLVINTAREISRQHQRSDEKLAEIAKQFEKKDKP